MPMQCLLFLHLLAKAAAISKHRVRPAQVLVEGEEAARSQRVALSEGLGVDVRHAARCYSIPAGGLLFNFLCSLES